MKEVEVIFKNKNGEIKKETYLISGYNDNTKTKAEQRRYIMAQALKFSTGYGNEDYYSWDDPEILEREIISITIKD